MKFLDQIRKHKRSDTAIFFGCGASISRLTRNDWVKLKKYDTWTLNNFAYHRFIFPKFYFIQNKSYSYLAMKQEFASKETQYSGTIFLFHLNKKIRLDDGSIVLPESVLSPKFVRYGFVLKKRRPSLTSADYDFDDHRITCSCNASLTFCLETLYRLSYERVVLYGVDLYTSQYFWSDERMYPTAHRRTNQNRPPDEPHKTYSVKDFVFDCKARWFSRQAKQLLVGHRDTALFPGLACIDIEKT